MSKKMQNKVFSYILSFVMLVNVISPGIIPLKVIAEEAIAENTRTIVVDAQKDDWEGIDPLTPAAEGYDENKLGDLYLTTDDDSLYFWIDANEIDHWGENGQYINIAFQINDEDSENINNPWSSRFDYSGIEKQPQYHLSLRIKNDDEVNWVQFSEAVSEEGFTTIFNSDDLKGAAFSLDRTIGFEGQIPLEAMGVTSDDEIQAHVTLSGNGDHHGAFDVIPKTEGNSFAFMAEGVGQNDVQSVYTDPYTVTFNETETPTEIDTAAFEELIETAKSYRDDSTSYTAESLTNLDAAIVNAEEALPLIGTEEELEKAIQLLQTAIEQLVEVDVTDPQVPVAEGYFRLHFETLLSDDVDDLGLWLWEDVATPSENWPTGAMSLNDAIETDYGYSMDFELADDPEKIGFLINSKSGQGQTEEMMLELLSPEMNEAWVTSDWEIYPYEPLADENLVRVNYLRTEADYTDWGLWTWGDVAAPTSDWPGGAHDFNPDGLYGSYVDLALADNPAGINFLLVHKETQDQTQDMAFSEFNHTQIFLREGDDRIYTNPYFVRESGLIGAEIISENQIELAFDSTEGLTEETVRSLLVLKAPDGTEVDLSSFTVTVNHERNVVLIEGPFDYAEGQYTITFDQTDAAVKMGWRLKDALYAYDGELGAALHEDGTATLKLWSPSAEAVDVVLYDKADQDVVVDDAIEMTRGERGVWQVELNEETTGLSDLTGYYYHYSITREGESVLALDPYAKSLAAWDNSTAKENIAKAAIVDPSAIGPELNYANIEGFEKREDAIIYEIHVRDFTSDPSISEELTSQFGTFSSFVDKLDYIEDLGVTHIQLLPVMSYYFANEFISDERMLDYASTQTNYNWGYDPQSYFSLTGMYSEDPTDPERRIEEFKNLIDEIHSRGMGVILDVVYNHTAQMHLFEDLEPNYYHFMTADGTPKESFGGGRLGTTHAMSRRILVDSITYWVEEFKVDGFRFDMMGDHDAESIQKAYDEAAALNPNILMIGEGWVTYAGDDGDNVRAADQQWMQHTEAVGSFSDDFRNELKSGFGSEGQPRFLTGGARSVQRIFDNLTANPSNFTADDPGDVVPYIAAHDNLTLHDVIAQSIKKDPKDHAQEIHERIRLGNLLVLTAQGTPFLHAGQEYGRTKQFRDPNYIEPVAEAPYKSTYMTDEQGEPFEYPYFIHDSYDSTDAVNMFDWEKATNEETYPINTQTRAYTKGLIELRSSTDAFSKGTMEEIEEMVSLVPVPEIKGQDLAIVYRAEASDGEVYYVLVNTDTKERAFTLNVDLSKGDVLVDAQKAGTSPIADPSGISIAGNKVSVEPLSASIVRVTDEVTVPVDPTTPLSPVINEDGTVTFNYQGDTSTESVGVSGSFNGWNTDAFQMEKGENDLWSYTADLTPGVYEYKFLVNGTDWINDPENKTILDNTNNQLILPGLFIEGEAEVEPGTVTTLSAVQVDAEGNRNEVEAEYSLADPIEGVTISGDTLTVSEDVRPETQIEVIASYGDTQATLIIDVLGVLYEYTIHYSRPDEKQMDWDLWIWEDGKEGQAYPFTETTEDGFAKATISFASDEINLITRLDNWAQQESDRVISMPEGQTAVDVWIIGGNPEVYYAKEDIEVTEQRYVELTYIREDADYDNWNLWVWNTGVQDDEILFDEITEEGAVANIAIGQNTTEIGFVIRYGQDWAVKDPYGEDRFIAIDPDEQVTKVTVWEGQGEFHTVPSLDGPVIEEGNATFFYRDPELYLADEMATIDDVQLNLTKVDENNQPLSETASYEMAYDALNEYFAYTLENIEEGTYVYTFSVTREGETVEVNDPYNTVDGVSTLTFAIPDVTAEATVYPKAISYNENAVVSINPTVEEGYQLAEAYLDARPVGGPEKVAVDLELMEVTIAVEQSTPVGVKTLDIILVDEFSNKHVSSVEVEVVPREVKNAADFDWDEARIYFMLTDRFSDGDPTNNNPNGENYDPSHPESYHGGDFQGILNNLDYLEELGINTIWITPIVDNIDFDVRHGKEGSQYGYHGYWAKDFTQIDEHLGDLETFKELIDQAHDRGMKIMVDVVLNHTGYGLKPTDEGAEISNYPTDEDRARFEGMIRENPVPGSDILGELSGLPDFKTEDPAVREQIIEWQAGWLERARTDRGDTIDYFRVDTVKHVEPTTWNAFKNELTKIRPDFKLIGEFFGASMNNTGDNLRSGRMDSLLDFEFKNQAAAFIHGNIEEVETALSERNGRIDNTAMMGQFLSSHDEDGFLIAHADGDEGLMKVAAALQITAKGQPVIYYGEEIGLSGRNAGDMDNLEFSENRYDFDWDRVGNDMHTHYQKLLNIRKDYSAIFSKGSRSHIAGTNESGYSVFARTYNDESLYVGLNTKATAVTTTFETAFVPGTKVTDLYNEMTYTVEEDQTLTVKIPGNDQGGTVVLVANEEEPAPEPDTDAAQYEPKLVLEYTLDLNRGNGKLKNPKTLIDNMNEMPGGIKVDYTNLEELDLSGNTTTEQMVEVRVTYRDGSVDTVEVPLQVIPKAQRGNNKR